MEFKAHKVLILFGFLSLAQFCNGEKNGYCDIKMTAQVQEKIKITVAEMKKENFEAKADSFRKMVKQLPEIPKSARYLLNVCKFTVKNIIKFNRMGKLQKMLADYSLLLSEFLKFLGHEMTDKTGYQPPSAAAIKKRNELRRILKRYRYLVLRLRALIAKTCKFNNDMKEELDPQYTNLRYFVKGSWCEAFYLEQRYPKLFLSFQRNLVGSIKLLYQALVEDLEFQQRFPQLVWILDKVPEATTQ